jgi:hypothetical protein
VKSRKGSFPFDVNFSRLAALKRRMPHYRMDDIVLNFVIPKFSAFVVKAER